MVKCRPVSLCPDYSTPQLEVQKTNLKQYEGLSAKVDAAVTKQLKESEQVGMRVSY